MEISLTPTPVSDIPPMTHRITDYLDDITTEQQGLLTAIRKEDIEDLAAPKIGNWTPISYANENLQFTSDINRPATYTAPEEVAVRPMITSIDFE